MPNRIVREKILGSDKVNKLTWAGEVFYRRLMSVVDDFGRYDGRPSMIRSSCFPLRLDKVSEADIGKWMDECSIAGLISIYLVEGKPYLELLQFDQTVRIKKSKYPPMQADECKCKQMPCVCMSGTNPIQSNPDTGVGGDETKNFFRIGVVTYWGGVGDWFFSKYTAFCQQYAMNNKPDITGKVVQSMNVSRFGATFRDEDHIRNTFISTWTRLSKEPAVTAAVPGPKKQGS